MTIDQEPRQQSLSQALYLSYRELSLQGSMPRKQPFAGMESQEERALLLAAIELTFEIMSDVDVSIFDNPILVSSVLMS
jgi:hypothetical protein